MAKTSGWNSKASILSPMVPSMGSLSRRGEHIHVPHLGLSNSQTRRHIDIRLLPSLVPESVRSETAQIIEPELSARINKLKNLIDAGIIDQQESSNGSSLVLSCLVEFVVYHQIDEVPKTTCPFTFYAQIDPANVPERLMQELEDEIQRPTGIWTVAPPKLSMGGLLISKECGLMYQVTNSEGLRYVLPALFYHIS